MQNLVPTPRPVLDFEPVPRKYRYDGWTAERQRAFIAALADTGSVKAAARRINMAYEGAYALRRQPGADGFRAAWDAAFDHGVQCLTDIAIDRAIEGVPVPIHWRGEIVGEKRRYNDRLLMFILRHHRPDRYGAPGLRGGTKNPATIEREAAENCPVCKRAAEAEQAITDPNAQQLKAAAEVLAALLKRYRAKVTYERRARLKGDIVAADYAVRQLTCIELMTAFHGSDGCTEIWNELSDRMLASGTPEDPETETVEMCRQLDKARREVWDAEGLRRPPTDPTDGAPQFHMSGDDITARYKLQERACADMAKAQAMWEAGATEAGWRAWLAAGGR